MTSKAVNPFYMVKLNSNDLHGGFISHREGIIYCGNSLAVRETETGKYNNNILDASASHHLRELHFTELRYCRGCRRHQFL